MVTAVSSPAVVNLDKKPSVVPGQVPRLVSVDVLRGLVMVIMALDHTRDFLTSVRTAPEDLAHTSGALFFTRFITHFCAPVFAFLAGSGAFLATRRGKSIPQVSRFFLMRGLWLLLLEFTIVARAAAGAAASCVGYGNWTTNTGGTIAAMPSASAILRPGRAAIRSAGFDPAPTS